MTRAEKVVSFVVGAVFVTCLLFEGRMATAIGHFRTFGKCTACMSSGGGGGF